MKKLFLILIFCLLLIPSSGWSACTGSSPTWTCASWTDLETLIEGASVLDGDTVNVSAGSYTANSQITIPEAKKLYIIGAGIGSTVATTSTTAFNINASGSRISGFEFNMTNTSVCIYTSHTEWRIDHCEIDYTGVEGMGSAGSGIRFQNQNKDYPTYEIGGLIDNCTFKDVRISTNGSAYARNAGAYAYHSAPLGLGESLAVYIEDNAFTSNEFGNFIDGNRSGCYVVRFNTFNKTGSGGSVIEAHSLQADSERAIKKWEIYENDITHGSYYTMLIRGGTGIVFNNTITGGANERITLDNVRDTYSIGVYGKCDGTETDVDSNEGSGANAGWLCRDQIGSGADTSAFDGSLPLPAQNKVPAYFWNNDGVDPTPDSDHIAADRDYYDEDASFDGTSGVGSGTLASRPATCTAGVAYWATDQGGNWSSEGGANDGCLYTCDVGDNAWTLYYIPYIYPHPLRAESSAALTGTYADGATEAEVVAGTEGLIITLTGDTWDATMGTNVQLTKDLIAGIDSGGSEATGWDAEVKGDGTDHLTYLNITRTNSTVVTIDFDAEASYAITTNETITITVPASALAGNSAIVATPTFEITATSDPAAALTGTFADNALEAEIVTGGETIIITLTNDTWVAAGATFDGQRQAIINGIDSAQSEATGWDAEVKAKEVVTAVVRTNSTVVTITLSAAAAYDISANETVTVTVPAVALVTSESPVVATPTSDIIFFDVSTEKITGITIQ